MKINEALKYAPDTEVFVTGDVLPNTGSIYRDLYDSKPAFIVADENTYEVAGRQVVSILRSQGIRISAEKIFPANPRLVAEYARAEEIRELLKDRDVVPVAIGSGTINDLVKVASFELGIRYMIVATAASVDGYSAPGASILKDGFKQSLYCLAPQAVISDAAVLQTAPSQMAAAGYADLYSKVSGGSDWIIADALKIDPIDSVSWRMVQEDLHSWLSDPAGIKEGRVESLNRLYYGLTMTGFSMQRMRRSRPASGAEHLMSHIWEMGHLAKEGVPISHGFKVGIATLACIALAETVMQTDVAAIDVEKRIANWPDWDTKEQEIRSLLDELGISEDAVVQTRAKYLTPLELNNRLSKVQEGWGDLRTKVLNQIGDYRKVREHLQTAESPVTPDQIGLSRLDVVGTFIKASMIRSRYTVIDLALEIGILEDACEKIMNSDYYLR